MPEFPEEFTELGRDLVDGDFLFVEKNSVLTSRVLKYVADSTVSTHSAAVLTLAEARRGEHILLDTTSNNISVEIPDTLPAGLSLTFSKAAAANTVTFAPQGTMTVEYSGTSDATFEGTWIELFVESATQAYVRVLPPGLERSITDPLITASVDTNTITHSSRRDVDSSGGAITITVSTGTAGDEMQLRVVDITNTITISPSGTTIQYHGKNTVDAVGDLITFVWWSSTEVVATITGTV